MTSMDRGADTCTTLKGALHAFVDGELDSLGTVTAEQLAGHLGDCLSCTTYLAHLRILKEKVRCSCGCAAPAALHERVVARLTQLYSDGTSAVYSDEIHVQGS